MTRDSVLNDPTFPALKTFVLSHTGLAYYDDKDDDLAARLARRMETLRVPDCKTYLDTVTAGAGGRAEMEFLIGELTIGETYFFRQIEHFDLLKSTIIPALLRQNAATRSLRIWSAGCATGEEPYSIAIELYRCFASDLAGWDVRILATDINPEFLARARAARYGEWSLRATPAPVRALCFTRQGKFHVLKPEYKKRVSFQRVNLADNDAIFLDHAAFDLIICRNVLIYFSRELVAQTIDRFRDALKPAGWLIVGHAEFSPEAFGRFERVQVADASVYRRPLTEGVAAQPLAEPIPLLYDLGWNLPPRKKSAPPPARTQKKPKPLSQEPSLEQVRQLADRGSWHAAAALGRRLTESQPLSAAAHFTLGLILESTLSCAEAKDALRRAIYLDRNFALAHYHLATCLQTEKQNARARKSFQNTIQLLEHMPPDQRLEHADGLTVADLQELARLHLETLEERAGKI